MKKSVIKKEEQIDTQQYYQVLLDVKIQIDQSQAQAFQAINEKLNQRNWLIGKIITEKQKEYSWGSAVIDRFVQDIQKLYPGIEGFLRTNIFRMKAFYEAYKNPVLPRCLEKSSKNEDNAELELLYKNPGAPGQLEKLSVFMIPWYHNVIILEKVKNKEERFWYADQVIKNGWSGSVLEQQIQKNLFARDGKAISNFSQTLPQAHLALAQQTFKDPYIFDFLKLQEDHLEHELEQGLIDNVLNMILEMGKGFALVGRQHHIQVGGEDFYIDLLFFHITLKCYVVVELKAKKFDKSDAGQINFYISAVDNLMRTADQNPTIGLVLCKSKNDVVARYALQGINRPIGVAEYAIEIVEELHVELRLDLPSVKDLEQQLKRSDLIEYTNIKIKKTKASK